jgi:hypothetical protein
MFKRLWNKSEFWPGGNVFYYKLSPPGQNPKLQKFHTQEEADAMFKRLWNKSEFWPGGNVFYYKLSAPKGVNPDVLSRALELEFDMPYSDGTTMGLVAKAKDVFGKRLKVKLK